MTIQQSTEKKAVSSLHQTLHERCREYGDREALISSADPERTFTHGEIASLSATIAYGLRKGGCRKGTRVGLLADNCPEWGIIYLAILSAGGVVVPLDPILNDSELAGLFEISKIEYLFVPDDKIDSVSVTLSNSNTDVIIIGMFDSIAGARLLASQDQQYLDEETRGDDTAALIYTSGTTGDPKGVILTHRNLIANLEQIEACLPIPQDSVYLSILPIHHTFEATTGFLYPLYNGNCVIYARALNSRDIIEDIRDYSVNCMVGVPLVYEKMYKSIRKKLSELPLFKRLMFSFMYRLSKIGWKLGGKWGKGLFRGLRKKAGMETIELFISGGGPLLPEIAEFFNLIGFDFLEGYGLTECAPVVSVNLPDDNKFGSVGPPLPGIELDIHEPGEDGVGEIIVKGENNSPGYVDNPEATSKLRKGEWLFTGDLGMIEKDRLYILGRAKNLIITAAGKNVYPEEIEEYLSQSDYISEAIVIGRKRENRMGEDICAIVHPDIESLIENELVDPISPEAEKIREVISGVIKDVNRMLSPFKRITKFDIKLEEFKKTTTRKIKRNVYN